MIWLAGLKNGRCGYYRKKWGVIQRFPNTGHTAVELNFTQSKKILDLLKRQAFMHPSLDTAAIATLNCRTRQGRDMTDYQRLLAVAIDSIAAKSEEKGVASLFSKGGTVLSATSSQGIEDFIVVSYLILTEAAHG